jgi:hypothetical protein
MTAYLEETCGGCISLIGAQLEETGAQLKDISA